MDCPTASSGCVAARSGAGSGVVNNNNSYVMGFVDVDNDASTSNSSTATLALPAGSTVLHARLVWGGRSVAGSGGVAPTKSISTVRFKLPNAAYTTVTAGTLIQPSALVTSDSGPYQASADVTAQVAAGGNGVYTVGDMGAATGSDRYAGWSLVVAYRNPALPNRNLRIFEGFADVTSATGNNSVNVPVSGFLAPPSGQVNASVGVVAWEGDYGTTGDSMRLASTTLSDNTRPTNNFFDSRISEAGADTTGRQPGNLNNFGVDIGRIDTTNVLANGSTSTTINVTSTGDSYYPGIITSQIDLFTPQFNAISKTVTNLNGHSPAQPGDVLEYRLDFTNSGGDSADASIMRDPLPAGLTYVPGSTSVITDPSGFSGTVTDATGDDRGEYTAADRTVKVRVGTGANASNGGTIATNASVSIRFRATVDRAAAGTTLVNTPYLDYTARTLNKPFSFAGAPTNTTVQSLADLAVTKTAANATQNAGTTAQYTVAVRNNGPTEATGVVLTDTLPSGATFESASTPSGVTCTPFNQTVTCQVGTVANGATVSVGINARIDPALSPSVLVNSASATATTADDIPANNTSSTSTNVTSTADLRVASSLAPATVVPGTQVVASASVNNAGPSTARAVVFTAPVPTGATFVSSSTGCTATSGLVTCALGNLAPGVTVTPQWTMLPASSYSAATLSVTSTASSSTAEANQADNSATATAPAAARAGLSTSITAASPQVVAGTRTGYSITVANAGPSDARDVTVRFPAVTGVRIANASPQLGTCVVTNGAVTCSLDTLPAGASGTVALTVDLNADVPAGPLTVGANVTTSTSQDTTADDAGSVTTAVQRVSDLVVTKSATPQPVIAGQSMTYTMTVTNRGPSAAAGTRLVDTLPAGLTVQSVSTTGECALIVPDITCELGQLPVGGTSTVTVAVGTPGTIPPGGFVNTVNVTSSGTDPNTADNTATHTASVQAQADLVVTQTADRAEVVAGDALAYRIDVTNGGPSTANAVTYTETLPAGFQIADVTTTVGTCTVTGTRVDCALGALASAAVAHVEIVAFVPPNQDPGARTVSGTATSTTSDPTTSNNTAGVTTTVVASANLQVYESDLPTPFTAGETFTRTVQLLNAGPSDARGTSFVAELPDGLIDVVASVGGVPCAVSGTRVTCPIGVFAAESFATVTITGRASPSADVGAPQATVSVTAATPDPDPLDNTIVSFLEIATAANLTLASRVDTTPLIAGGRATYTTTLVNEGPSDARDVVLTGRYPAPLTVLSATSSLGSCTTSGADVTCTAAQVPAGASVVVTVTVAVDPTATGNAVTNIGATTTTADPDGVGPAPVVLTTPIERQADLILVGSAASEPVRAGTAQTYTLTVTNAGPSTVDSATLADTLPTGLVLLPNGVQTQQGTCTPRTDGTGVDCALGRLEVGATATVVLTAFVPAATPPGTTLVNTAVVSAPIPDPTPADRELRLTNTTSTQADLSTTMTVSRPNAEAGLEQEYAIRVVNNGPSVADSVVVVDALPTGSVFRSATASVGSCALVGTEVRCSFGSLAPGAAVTAAVVVQVASDLTGSVVNTATASAVTADPNTADNAATVTQNVTASADLTASAVITSGAVTAGRPVSYRVATTNQGPALARTVVLTSPLPTGTNYVTAVPTAGGSCQLIGRTVRCTWPQVAVGAQVSADITLAVDSAAPLNTATTLSVTSSSALSDPDGSNNSASASYTATATADVSVVTVLSSGAPVAGGRMTWQSTVRNTGPSAAYNVVFDNPAPTGVTLDGATTTLGTCQVFAGLVRCPIGTVGAGAAATVTFTGLLAADFAGPNVTDTSTVTTTGSTDPNPADNTSTVVSDASSSADLNVSLITGATTLTPGLTGAWTLAVVNDGPSLARGAIATVAVPAGVTLQVPAGCVAVAGGLSCALGDLAPGQRREFSLTATVDPGYTDPDVRVTASALSGTPDPDPADNSAATTTTVTPDALLIVDVVPPASVTAGADATWTVRATVAGPSDADAVVVTVAVPPSVLDPVATWPGGTCDVLDGTVTCALGHVAAGGSIDITLTGRVDPAFTGDIQVDASIDSPTPGPEPDDDTSSTSADGSADLEVTLTSPTEATPGTRATWVLRVRDLGPSQASAVVATATLPEGFGSITATGSCTVTGRQVSCPIGDLAPGATALFTVEGVLAADVVAGPLTAEATVTSDTPDPTPANNTVTTTTTSTPRADLAVAKAVTSGVPIAGAQVEFLIEVSDRGPSDARDVVVLDTLSTSISGATATTTQGACTVTGQDVRCELGTVRAGAGPVSITVRGTLADGSDSITNAASAVSTTPEIDPADNTSEVTSSATDSANLGITVDAPATIVAGQPLEYVVTVSNAGPSSARSVAVSSLVPAELLDAVVDNASCGSPTACSFGDIAPGASVTYRVSGTVDPLFTGSTLQFRASASATTGDPDARDNTAVVDTSATSSSDLSVTLSADPSPAVPGRALLYTATVSTTGPSAALGVVSLTGLPVGLSINGDILTDQGTCEQFDDNIVCDLGPVLPGRPVVIQIPVSLSGSFDGTEITVGVDTLTATADPDPANNSASATTPVTPLADLRLDILAPDEITPGSPVRWEITAVDDGPSDAAAIVEFTLPEGLDDVVVTPLQGTCDITGRTVRCDLGTIVGGTSLPIEVTATARADITAATLTLTATLTSPVPEADPTPPDGRTASATSPVAGSADLSIVTSAQQPTLVPGEAASWAVVVTDDGPSDARDVAVDIVLPTGVTGGSVIAPAGVTCTGLRCTIPVLQAGADVTLIVTGAVAPDVTDPVLLVTSTVSAATADPDLGDNSSTSATATTPTADLSVAVTSDPSPLVAGSPATVAVTVTNSGPSTATGVELTLPIPPGLVDVTVTAPAGVTCDTTVRCTIASLPTGSVRIEIAGRVPSDTAVATLAFPASVTSPAADPNPADNTATLDAQLDRAADVSTTLAVTPDPLVAGSAVTLTARVANAGPSVAENVDFTLPIPADVTVIGVTAPPGVTCDASVRCTADTLAAGADFEIVVTGTLSADYVDGTLAFTGTVATTTPDPDQADNTATVNAGVGTSADVSVAVTADPLTAGSPGTVVVTVTNSGPSTATGVEVTLPIPAGFTDVTVSAPPGVTCDSSVRCTIASLPVGDVRIEIAGRVPADSSATSLTFPVTVTSPVADPDPADNAASATPSVGRAADVSTELTVSPSPLVAGSSATITARVANAGPSVAQGIEFTLPIPAGLTVTGVTAPPGVTCDSSVRCTAATLGAGDDLEIVVEGTVAADFTGPSLAFTGTSTTTTPDTTPANNAASVTATVGTSADLSVTVASNPDPLTAGSPATVVVTVTNSGPSTATDVVVTVPIPAGFLDVTVTAPAGVTCDASVRCTIASVPTGDVRIEITGRVPADSSAGSLDFPATVTSPVSDPDPADNTATLGAAVQRSADVSTELTVSPLVAGSSATITARVSNTGPSVAENVEFTLPVPAGVTITGVTAPAGVTCDQTVRCTAGTLVVGATVDITVTAAVDAGYTGASIGFTGTSSTSTSDPDQGNNAVTVDPTVDTSADLSVTVASSPDPLVAGSPATVVVTVTNSGPSTATDVVVTVPIPAGFTDVTVTAPAGVTCDNSVRCTIASVPAGDVRIEITGRVPSDSSAATLEFPATVASPVADPDPSDNTAVLGAGVTRSADVSTELTVSPSPLVAGSPLTATARISNAGPSLAENLVFTLPVPAGVTITGVTAPPGVDCDTSIRCTAVSLATGATLEISVAGTLDAAFTGATVGFTATTGTTTPDASPSNNADTVDATVTTSADLSVAVASNPDPLVAGSPATIAVTVTNSGPSTATGVEVTLPIPAGFVDVTVNAPAGVTCDASVRCTIASLPVGDVRIEITGRVPADSSAGSLDFPATVTSPVPDPDPADNTATLGAGVSRSADVSTALTVSPTPLVAGSPVTLTARVANAGPSQAENVEFTLPIPAGVTVTGVTAPPGVMCDSSVRCTTASLASGAGLDLVVAGTVDAGYTGTSIGFTATSSSSTADADQGNNAVTVDPTVSTSADLSVTVVSNPDPLTAGSPATVAVTVTNSGPSTATGVVVTLPIPAGFVDVTVNAPAGVTCDTSVRCTIASVPTGDVRIEITGRVPADSSVPSLDFPVTVTSPVADPDPSDNSAVLGAGVRRSADVSTELTVSPSPLIAGSPLTINARVANAGPSLAENVVFTLPVPAGVTITSIAAPPGVDCDTSIRCTAASLTVGSTVDISVTGTLDAGSTATTLGFTGTSTTTTPDATPANNAVTVDATVGTSADLSVVVASEPNPLVAGSPATVAVTVTNSGPSTATDVVVTLPIPAGFTDVTVTAPAGVTCDTSVRCTIATLPAGDVRIEISGRVPADASVPSLDFPATVTSPVPDPDPSDNSAVLGAGVSRSADVATELTVTPAPLVAGSAVTATARISNAGPSVAESVEFTLPVPAGVTVTGVIAPPGVTCDQTVRCTAGTLAVGATVDITVLGTVDAGFTGASLGFTATSSTSTTDGTPGNNAASVTAAVGTSADLSVVVASEPNPLVAGSPATIAVTVTNSGPSTATGVVVTLPIPAGFVDVTVNAPAGVTCDTTVRCTIASVPTGDVRIEITGRVPADSSAPSLDFPATVASPVADPDPSDNSAVLGAGVTRSADVSTELVVSPAPLTAGSPLTIAARISNAGPSLAQNVEFTLPIPAGVTITSIAAPPGIDCDTSIRCTAASLTVGSTVDISVTGTLDAGSTATTLGFTATSTTTTPDATPANNAVTVNATVGTSSDLSVTVASNPDPLTAGSPATVVVTVTNSGPSTATDVVVTVPIPAGFVDVTVTAPAGVTCDSSVRCTIASVPAGDVRIEITGRVPADTSVPSLDFPVTVTSPVPDPDPSDNNVVLGAGVQRSADVSTALTVSPSPLTAGAPLTITAAITNSGPSDAENIEFTLPVPAGVTVTSIAVPPGVTCDQAIRCTAARIGAGTTATISVTGTLAADFTGPSLDLTATSTTTTTDPTPANNAASVTTGAGASADLSVAVTSGALVPGTPATVAVTVTNSGPSNATGVVVTLPIPAGFTVGTVTAPAGVTCDNSVRCAIPSLVLGDVRIEIAGQVPADVTDPSLPFAAAVTSPVSDPDPADNTATLDAPVGPSADVATTLEVSPTPLTAGLPVTVTAHVANTGPSTAGGIVFTLPVPAGVTVTGVTAPAGVTCDQTVRCTAPTLGVGAQVDIVVTGTVAADLPGNSLTFTGTTGATTPDATPDNNSASVTAAVGMSADLSVNLASSPSPLIAGSLATIAVTVTNSGPSAAAGAEVSVPLPAGFTDVVVTAPAGATCDTTVRCVFPSLPTGEVRIEITGRVPAATPTGSLDFPATVSSSVPDPDPSDNTAVLGAGVERSADVATVLTVTPSPLTAGAPLTLRALVSNTGPSTADGIEFTLSVPGDVTITSIAVPPGVTCDQSIRCTTTTVGAGATIEIMATGTVSADFTGTTLDFTAATSTTTPDPTEANNASSVTATVGLASGLAVSITSDPLVAGQPAAIGVTLTNLGPSTAIGVELTLPIPAGLTDVFVIAPDGVTCDSTVRCTMYFVPVGPIEILIQGMVPADSLATSLTFPVSVLSPADDPDLSDNTATIDVPVTRAADVSTTLNVTPSPLTAGSPLTIAARLSNGGPSDAQGVVFTLPVPAGVTVTSIAAPPGVTCDQSIRCTATTVSAGADLDISVTGVLATDFAGTSLGLTATAATTTPDPTPANNASSVTATVGVASDLSVAVASDPLVAGSPATVTVTVTNSGPSIATGVEVTVPIPAGFTDVTVVAPAGVTCDAAVRCTIGSLPVGDVRIRIQGRVPADSAATTLPFPATVTSPATDPDPADNTATLDAAVGRSSDVSTTLAVTPSPLVAGSPVTLRAVVSNAGPSGASGVVFTLPVPAGVTVTSIAAPPGVTCDQSIRCTTTTLGTGATLEIVATGVLAADFAGGTLAVTANTTTSTPDATPGNNGASVNATVVSSSDLSVTVTSQPTPLVAGSPATVAVTVTNSGPSTATGVVVTVPIPAGLTNVTVVAPAGVTCDTSVRCTIGSLPAGSVLIEIRGDVPSDTRPGTLQFPVTVTSPTADPDPADNTAVLGAEVVRTVDVSTELVVSPTPLSAGESATFTARVVNSGPSIAEGIVFRLPLPAGVTLTSVVASPSLICDETVRCTAVQLAAGEDLSIVVTGTLAPDYTAGTLAVAANTVSDMVDTVPGNNSTTVTTPVRAVADLTVSVATEPASPVAGSPVTVRVTVRNDGPATAIAAVLANQLPAGFTVTSVTGCADAANCVLGDLAPGEQREIVINGVLPADAKGTFVFTSVGSSATSDPDPADNTASSNAPVDGSADLRVAFTGPATLAAGAGGTWQVVVTNDGPSQAESVVVTATLPAGVTPTAPAGCTVEGRTVRCAFDALAVGATRTFAFTATAATDLNGTVTAVAAAQSAVADPDPADSTASVSTTVTGTADLAVTLALTTAPLIPGSQETFLAVVTNNGPATAANAQLTGTFNAGLTPVTVPSQCTVTGQALVCSLGAVAPGASITLEFVVNASSDVIPEQVSQSVTVSSSVPDPDDENNVATVIGSLAVFADMSITKTADVESVAPGGTITWTFDIRNDGPQTADGLILADVVPEQVEFVDLPDNCQLSGDVLLCELADMADQATLSLSLKAVVKADTDATEILNTVSINASTSDTDAENNLATSTVAVAGAAALGVTKTLVGESVVPGTEATWRITVANGGTVAATDVEAVDPLPAGLTFTGGDGCTAAGQVVTCALGTIPAGQSRTVDIRTAVDPGLPGDTVINSASVVGSDPGPGAAEAAQVERRTDLSVTKTVDETTVFVGDRVTWTVTVTNNGSSTAPEVIVREHLPLAVESSSEELVDGEWAVGALAPGESRTLTLTAVVDEPGELVNDVTLTAAGVTDRSADDDLASATTTVAERMDSPVLAWTGYELPRLVVLGLVLLLGGVLLLERSRRRE
ncbi:hypothetical protein GCM10022243_10330 [Saccharothrix violaceirubra]